MPTPTLSRAPSPPDQSSLRGADVVLRTLESEGIEVCFGMPGGAILPIYDALARGSTLHHVLVRHEQGAGHMAEGYARASGRVGVVFATSGPGATNLVTPIADAKMDSTPLLCITGQVRRDLIGTDAFQECDIVGVTRPLVKGGWQVSDVAEIAGTLRAALALALDGRPGPVLVDIPRDVQEAVLRARPSRVSSGPSSGAAGKSLAPGGLAATDLAAAVAAVQGAERPILYVGGGAQACADDVTALAERWQIPVVTTLMGKGAFSEHHPLFVGWPGMHGTKTANRGLNHADLIVAAGVRFDDRVTGRLDAFAPEARVIHVDVDRSELGKLRHAEVAIHGRLSTVLPRLTAALTGAPRHEAWLDQLAAWQLRFPLGHAPAKPGGRLKPQQVLRHLATLTEKLDDVVWTTGVGQHQMWAMQYLPVHRPRSFITSGGLGTMGFGFPAAIGAKVARPQATVVCVDGDGSFQMTMQELATAVAQRLPVIVVILNNGTLGMVHQWQSMFYDDRQSGTDLRAGMPSFAAIADGFGAAGSQVATLDELDHAFATALAYAGPSVLDVWVDGEEACFPMIMPGGAAVDQVDWNDVSRASLGHLK